MHAPCTRTQTHEHAAHFRQRPVAPHHHRHPRHGRAGRRCVGRLDRGLGHAQRLSGASHLGGRCGATHRCHDLLHRVVCTGAHRSQRQDTGAGANAGARRGRYRHRLRVDGGRSRHAAWLGYFRQNHAHHFFTPGLRHAGESQSGQRHCRCVCGAGRGPDTRTAFSA